MDKSLLVDHVLASRFLKLNNQSFCFEFLLKRSMIMVKGGGV